MKTELPGIDYKCLDARDEDLDAVYDQVDELMRHGRFDVVDSILERVKLEDIDVVTMLSYLTITYVAKSLLKNRAIYYDRVLQRLDLIVPLEREELLAGLQ